MSMAIRFLFLTGLCLCCMEAYAQDVTQQTRQRQELEKQIGIIDNQLTSNQAKQQSELKNLELVQQKVASRKDLLANIEVEIKLLNDSIKKNEGAVKALQAEYDKLEFAYLQMLYQAYTHRNRQIWAAHVLASDNLRQAYRRWQYFKNYSQYMTRQAAQMKSTNERLGEESARLRKMRTEAEDLRKIRQTEVTTLNQEERQSRQMVTTLSRQRQTLEAQLKQKQREVDAINKVIANIIAEAQKSRTTASAKEVEADKALAATFEQNKGQLPWPLNRGVITEPYGQHNHPVLRGIKMPFNNGIGILASHGDEVHAVFEGVVKQVVVLPAYNQCVLIQHGLYYTFYCRLGSVAVKVGDKVATGDVLGTLAEINKEYSLHFELWKEAQKQNPTLWLSKR